MAKTTLEIELTVDDKGVVQGVNRVGGSFNRLEQDSKRAAENAGQAFSRWQAHVITLNQALQLSQTIIRGVSAVGRTLIGFLQEATAAAATQEDAEKKRNAALVAAGQLTKAYVTELNAQAAAFQQVTRFGDETVIGLQQQLIAFGATRTNIKQLTQATLDLSSGMGIDLKASALLMGKAIAGEFSTLSRYGIFIDENASKTQKLQQVLDAISGRFGGQARAAAETYAGGLARLSNSWSDLQEQVGFALTQNRSVLAVINELVKIVDEYTKAVKNNRDGMQVWISDGLAVALELLGAFNKVLGFTVSTLNDVGAVITALKKAEFPKFDRSVEERFFEIERSINRLLEAARAVRGESAGAFDKLKESAAGAADEIARSADETDKVRKRALDLAAVQLKIARGVEATEKEAQQRRDKEFDARQDNARKLAEVQIRVAKGVEETQRQEARKTEERLKQLGETTINIGETISRTVGEAFEGVILGTSRLADVGKNLFAALLRSTAQFFSEALARKLGFEQIIFSNLRGFLPAANQALLSGAGGVSVAGAGGGAGGLGIPNIPGIGSIGGALGPIGAGLLSVLGGGLLGGQVAGVPGAIGGALGSGLGFAGGTALGGLTGIALAGGGGAAGAIGAFGTGAALGGPIGAILGGIAGIALGGGLSSLFGGQPKRQSFDLRVNLAFPQGQGATVGALLNPALGIIETGQVQDILAQRGGIAVSGGALAQSPENLARVLQALQQELIPTLDFLRTTFAGLTPEQQAQLSGTALDINAPDVKRFFAGQVEQLPGLDVIRVSAEQTVENAIRDFTNRAVLPAIEAFKRVGGADVFANVDLFDPESLAQRTQELAQQAAELQAQAEEAARIEAIFNQQIDALNFQISLIGKSAEEQTRLRRELELSQLAAQGLNDEQIQSIRLLAERSDELQRQLVLEQEALVLKEAQRAEVERQANDFDRLAADLKFQILAVGFDAEKLALEQFQNQVKALNLTGDQAKALSRLFVELQGVQRLETERLEQLREEQAIIERIQGIFRNTEEALRREVEEKRFELLTFGLAPEESAQARRDFELNRLAREGLGSEQLSILRELMSERDELLRALEKLSNPPPANVEINIQGGDPDAIAQAIADLLAGRTGPRV